MISDNMDNWRTLISEELQINSESFEDIIKITLSEKDLDKEFDSGYGGSEGEPFTAWIKNYVYFPAVYDGAEWVESVPRNPSDEETPHVGGQ